jgi:hypothetical protein
MERSIPGAGRKWAQWRLFGEGGDLLAVVPGDKLSVALDFVERTYDAGRRVEVSRHTVIRAEKG